MKKAKENIAKAIQEATGWSITEVTYERNKSNMLRRVWLDEPYLFGRVMVEGCILPVFFVSSKGVRDIANGDCFATYHKQLDCFTIYIYYNSKPAAVRPIRAHGR